MISCMNLLFEHEWKVLGVREPGGALTHGIAAILAVFVLVLMVVKASTTGTIWHIVGVSIFGATLVFTYSISMSSHIVPYRSARAKTIMQRLDRGAIYFLIAGTYTPICLTILRGPWGWSLLAVVWVLAIVGSITKFTGVHLPYWLPPTLYITLGWMAIVAIVPLYRILSWGGLSWLVGGGLAYTIGVVFFALEHVVRRSKWWGMHEIFHLFVILGSALHIILIWKYIL